MLPDPGSGGGDVVPSVAVERGVRTRVDPGEVQLRRQKPERKPGEIPVLGGDQGQLPAERLGAVRGHERLVAPVGVGAQRPFPAGLCGGGEQGVDRARAEERKVGGEDENVVRRRQPQPRAQRRQRTAALRHFPGPDDRSGGRTTVAHDDGTSRAVACREDPVEQRPAADPDSWLVGAAERFAAPPARTITS